VGDVVCFFLLTPLALISTYLCASGASFYMEEKQSEGVGLICLCVVLVIIYTVWVILTLRYHCLVWMSWRIVNQDIRLEEIGRDPVPSNKWRGARIDTISEWTSRRDLDGPASLLEDEGQASIFEEDGRGSLRRDERQTTLIRDERRVSKPGIERQASNRGVVPPTPPTRKRLGSELWQPRVESANRDQDIKARLLTAGRDPDIMANHQPILNFHQEIQAVIHQRKLSCPGLPDSKSCSGSGHMTSLPSFKRTGHSFRVSNLDKGAASNFSPSSGVSTTNSPFSGALTRGGRIPLPGMVRSQNQLTSS